MGNTKKNHSISSIENLNKTLGEKWERILSAPKKKLVESIPERLKEVTVNRGFQTLDSRETGRLLLEEARDFNVHQKRPHRPGP